MVILRKFGREWHKNLFTFSPVGPAGPVGPIGPGRPFSTNKDKRKLKN